MGMVFFNLPEQEQKKLELLNKLMPATFLRGFHGGIILSADGLDQRKRLYNRVVMLPCSFLSIDPFLALLLLSFCDHSA
jgi:hypothetical protein